MRSSPDVQAVGGVEQRLHRRTPELPRWAGPSFVALVFVASRIAYRVHGVRFDTAPIDWFSQLLDPQLLRRDLLRSLVNLHMQPPLYNLLTGLALKTAPQAPGRVLAPLFLLCSAYTSGCLYFLLTRLRAPRPVAALAAAAMVASPAWVLYENWYFYPHLNVTWLVGACAWLCQSRGRAGRAMLLAGAHVAGLVLTRSLFHPLFFVLFASVVVLSVHRRERLASILCFSLPGLLVLAVCLKNLVLFDFAGTSSWSSRNLCHTVAELIGPERFEVELKKQRFSPAVRTTWFETGDRNIEIFGLDVRGPRVPALDQVLKRTPPHAPNFNHWTFPATQDAYAADAARLLLSQPSAYLAGVLHKSLPMFLQPVTHGWFDKNRSGMPRLAAWFEWFDTSLGMQLFLVLGLFLAALRAVSRSCPYGERALIAAILSSVAWVVLVGTMAEVGENYRFRYKVLWLAWVLALSACLPLVRRALRFVRRLLPPNSQRTQAGWLERLPSARRQA